MLLRSAVCSVFATVVLVTQLSAGSGPRIPIPQGLPAELALELLSQIGDYARTLEGRFKEDSAAVKLHPPSGPSLSYSVPANVEVTSSEDILGLPLTRIQVTVAVRCVCIVSYDLKKIRVHDANELLLPEASVIPAYAEPPGQRGRWTSNASFFRWKSSPSIDAMKGRLLDDALIEAKQQYLHAHHHECEMQWAAAVQVKLLAIAEKRAANMTSKVSSPILPNSPHDFWITVVAVVVIGSIVIGAIYLSRR